MKLALQFVVARNIGSFFISSLYPVRPRILPALKFLLGVLASMTENGLRLICSPAGRPPGGVTKDYPAARTTEVERNGQVYRTPVAVQFRPTRLGHYFFFRLVSAQRCNSFVSFQVSIAYPRTAVRTTIVDAKYFRAFVRRSKCWIVATVDCNAFRRLPANTITTAESVFLVLLYLAENIR